MWSTLAFLSTFLQNNDEDLEPTSDAERARLERANPLGRPSRKCYIVTMTGQPIAQILPRKRRPQWMVPLVTALVFVAVIMVLYQPA